MSKKQRQPADDKVEFEVINREINLLMKRLHDRGICPCCVAQGMLYRGAFLHADIVGTEETIALCHDIADSIECSDGAGVPENRTQH